ncbi:haloacid dehalogenase type II, partial [Burkholderia cenocepacia]|nr:haloacid dehalogenase type II [Burkholderia cenocepacia]
MSIEPAPRHPAARRCEPSSNDLHWITMTNPAEIKALVFDVFGTIVDWRSGTACDTASPVD